jgi:Zn finger protein HypA/HybF involved in hydrogenase expression
MSDPTTKSPYKNLPDSDPGIVQCLGCDLPFHSPDKKRIRLCPSCHDKRDKVHVLRGGNDAIDQSQEEDLQIKIPVVASMRHQRR